MSAGAVPVIMSDGWALPFEEVVDWSTISVVIMEGNVEGAVERVRGIGWEERCEMRRRGRQVFERYMRSADGIVEGVVTILEERRVNVK